MKITPLLLLLAACGTGDVLADAQPPMPLGDALAYFDAPTSSLIVVRPEGGAGPRGKRLARLAIGEAAVQARSVLRAGGRAEIIVIDPGAESLHIVRDAAGNTDTVRVGVPLENLDVSPDGRWAVVYQADATAPSRTLFTFPNTVSVIDLAAADPTARTLRLPSPGARPLRAVFAERLELRANGTRDSVQLALIFVKGGVVPLDLEHGVAGEVVPLDGEPRDVLPAEVLFTANRGDDVAGALDGVERAFVRTEAGELFVLAIGPSPERLLGDTDALAVSVAVENVVTPDAMVHDIELFFALDGNALLLAAAGDEVVLVDAESGVASRFPQAIWVDTLARFRDPSDGRALALGYARQRRGERLLRLDPLGLDLRRSTGVEELRLGSVVAGIDIAAGAGRAVVHYEDGLDLGVLDLERGGEILDLRFARSVTARTLAPSGDRLWVAGTSPEDETPHLAEVRLDGSLDATDVELDQPGRSIGRAGGWLWVDHDDRFGSVTFFPAGDLRREAGVAFTGVLLTRIYDTTY